MKRKFDWRYVAGAALLAAVAALIVTVLSLLTRTNKQDLILADTIDERFGWSYEVLADGEVRAYDLEFEDGRRIPTLPEGVQAVRICRAMTEEIPNAELGWSSYLDGVEVFLNGELLHTDFQPDTPRAADGFLRPRPQDWSRLHRAQGDTWQQVRISLPADYLGAQLCVTTYFPEDWGIPLPEYPSIGSEDTLIAWPVALSARDSFTTLFYALLALALAIVFLLDITNGRVDVRELLLCLYFVLLFLDDAFTSYPGYFSALKDRLDLTFLCGLYVAPLYFGLTLRLRGRWKIPLRVCIVVWALWEAARHWLALSVPGNPRGLGAFALFLLVVVALCADALCHRERERQDRRRLLFFGAASVAVTLFFVMSHAHDWDSVRDYLRYGIGASLRELNFEPLLSLITHILSGMTLIAVVTGFVRRSLRTRQEVSVLAERARQTMEGYERLLAAESATHALHHEMRHHMTALLGLLDSGDTERAKRYAESVAGDFERLPAGQYSQNPLVDVIAGSLLNRALSQGIQVEHRLNVPPELHIADEDLSVFLSNMLQNALEACERMEDERRRFIRVEMRLRGKFLFIHCVNSAPEEAGEGGARPGHGYGLAAMRKVAEKYNSTLVIERSPGEYSVMSDLCLREGEAS